MATDWFNEIWFSQDLDPKHRLDILIKRGNKAHVDSTVDVNSYIQIAGNLLATAKLLKQKGKAESALLNFLRYQTLVQALRRHENYNNIPFYKRAAFEYCGREAKKCAKELKIQVFAEYKNCKKLITASYKELPNNTSFDTFQDTIKSKATYLCDTSRSNITKANSTLQVFTSQSSDSLKMKRSEGVRRSIVSSKQIRSFDEANMKRIIRNLRTVIIPMKVTTMFSYLSRENNINNIETVGYLAGKEHGLNELLITHLLIPYQIGFSDYFSIVNSNRLIRYLDANDLITIGWIHSHPIEKAYMSSSDIHYHSIIQNILPEAIAMVYSPKEMKTTTYNLTPNHGLNFITNCKKEGFHTHPTKPAISMVCQHAVNDIHADLIVEDFRKDSATQCKKRSTMSFIHSSADVFHRSIDLVTSAFPKARQLN